MAITEQTRMVTTSPPVLERSRSLFRGVQVVWYILGLVEIILALRFVLHLLAANPVAGFTQFVYGLSFPFVAPFQAVFPASGAQGYVFEWTTLLAMAVYWLVAWGVIKPFVMGRPVSKVEAHEELKQQDSV